MAQSPGDSSGRARDPGAHATDFLVESLSVQHELVDVPALTARSTQSRHPACAWRSHVDARTEALFRDQFVRDFQGIARPAKRRLEAINAAHRLDDLLVPPSNRLEKLKGNLKGFFLDSDQ